MPYPKISIVRPLLKCSKVAHYSGAPMICVTFFQPRSILSSPSLLSLAPLSTDLSGGTVSRPGAAVGGGPHQPPAHHCPQ